jgi:hypothetical protein
MNGAPSSCIRPARMGMRSLGPVEERERVVLGRKVPSATGKLEMCQSISCSKMMLQEDAS